MYEGVKVRLDINPDADSCAHGFYMHFRWYDHDIAEGGYVADK